MTGGWAAPLGEGPDWLDLPETKSVLDFPAISVRRGGIQYPTENVHTIRFCYRKPWWLCRWVVELDHNHSYVIYGEPQRRGTVTPLARFWRRSKAASLVQALDPAAGTRR